MVLQRDRGPAACAVLLVAALATCALLPAAGAAAAAAAAAAATPSKLSVDFSSTLFTSTKAAPDAVTARLAALLADMQADGVNNPCQGRLPAHVTRGASAAATDCSLGLPAATGARPCSCAGANNTRCSCSGQLTGAQFFAPDNYGLELARVLAVASGSEHSISGGINANFRSTVRLTKGAKLFVRPSKAERNGAAGNVSTDLELDSSHLDVLEGSHIVLQDDADLESEDSSTVWLAGKSSIWATRHSNMEFRLNHMLIERNSSVTVADHSTMDTSQEYDMTPAQAAAVCDTPFQPDPAAEACFRNKEACKARWALLTNPERQAVHMLQYPPALDQWGRQAFDYTDDVLYDDMYDQDYVEPELEQGSCLGGDVCEAPEAQWSGAGSGQPPVPAEPRSLRRLQWKHQDRQQRQPQQQAAAASSGSGSSDSTYGNKRGQAGSSQPRAEVNAFDSADGKGYDPAWGVGPYGETLCDAPPFRAFGYYGVVVRGSSAVKVSGSSRWTLYDQSRVFVVDSAVVLKDNATLHLLNSTMVLINSRLVVKGGSQVILQHGSGLHLYNSKVVGDNAMYALPRNSTFQGQPWSQPGDYRASAGGSLPRYMGAQPGVQLGTYAMRVSGFGLEARLLPAAGCRCKAPVPAVPRVALATLQDPAA